MNNASFSELFVANLSRHHSDWPAAHIFRQIPT